MATPEEILIGAGVAAVLGAVIGGGLEGFGVKLPLISSMKRQIILALAGAALIVIGLLIPSDPPPQGASEAAMTSPDDNGQGAADPIVEPIVRFEPIEAVPLKLDFNNDTTQAFGNTICFAQIQLADVTTQAPGEVQENMRLKALIGVFPTGRQGARCSSFGDYYQWVEEGESIAMEHPTCRLRLLVTNIVRKIKPPHTWQEWDKLTGNENINTLEWLDRWVDAVVVGECPS